ncbi:MAG: hypothetical protein ACRETK_00780 [Steroidobacteraceae bacterium]
MQLPKPAIGTGALFLTGALLLAGLTGPANAATRYIGHIGPNGALAAPDADIAVGLQRVNLYAYASGDLDTQGIGAQDMQNMYDGEYDAAGSYGRFSADGVPPEQPAARPSAAHRPSAPPVSGVPVTGVMLLAGLGLLSMVARRRTFLR